MAKNTTILHKDVPDQWFASLETDKPLTTERFHKHFPKGQIDSQDSFESGTGKGRSTVYITYALIDVKLPDATEFAGFQVRDDEGAISIDIEGA